MHQPITSAKEIVSTITSKGQVTIPAAIRKHLGVSRQDKVAFVIDTAGTVELRPTKLTLAAVRGVVPALKDREPTDFDEQIAEAMDEEAARIVGRLKGS